ncbi:MAG: hypothetical protein RLY61_430 [Candidatus Parcubacteria bacterium]|jgi:hypothetical protein
MNKDKRLIDRILSNEKITTDVSSYLDLRGQAFIGMLTDIDTFARKYSIKRRGILRHIRQGDIPCVVISGCLFVLDLGEEEMAKSIGYELGVHQIEIIDKLINENLKNVKNVNALRRSKSGHARVEIKKEWVKDLNKKYKDYFNN